MACATNMFLPTILIKILFQVKIYLLVALVLIYYHLYWIDDMLHTSHTPTGAIMKMQEGQPKPQTVPLVLRSHGRNEIWDINTYVQPSSDAQLE